MSKPKVSRRGFLSASAGGGLLGATALADPALAAAQAVGVKKTDLPDLTIKEVKVYVTDFKGLRSLNEERGQIASVVTSSGIEGNAVVRPRMYHPNWNNLGWLEYAKRVLVGKNAMTLPQITSQWSNRGQGQSSYSVGIDTCLWDIIGKAVGLPIYKVLGGYKDKVLAYASSAHLKTVEMYGPDVQKAKEEGFKAYKIHPGSGQMGSGRQIPSWKGHIEEIKLVRETAGDDMTLLFDPVQRYNRDEAMKVGRALEQYGYASFEDPIPTSDINGLVDLARSLDIPVEVGEFIFSMYDFPEYIQRGALDIVRLIIDNVGGITSAMKVGHLAECYGMTCTPHNWGELMDLAAHFHVELALPNAPWFEIPFPQSGPDRPYHKDKIRIDKDGYVPAPTEPGLGYPIDHDALDKLMIRVER